MPRWTAEQAEHDRAARICACGGAKSRKGRQCLACAIRQRRGSALNCEWCRQVFWRRKAKRDTRRFCSKQCAMALRILRGRNTFQDLQVRQRAIAGMRQYLHDSAPERARRREQREQWDQQQRQYRIQQQQARTACPCGTISTYTRWTYADPVMRYWCDACYIQEFYAWEHVCPDCGASFFGQYRDTYCSPRCATRLRHMVDRGTYPAIGRLPLDQRNQLAEMIALMRAANRAIYQHG